MKEFEEAGQERGFQKMNNLRKRFLANDERNNFYGHASSASTNKHGVIFQEVQPLMHFKETFFSPFSGLQCWNS